MREGCYLCHSQMIRALRAETQRYGAFSVASESVYDRPFQWGSKRTGPDLARVGGKYSDEWQRLHLLDPRAFVPESNMPAYPWLDDARWLDGNDIAARMRALRTLGDPYTDDDIAARRRPSTARPSSTRSSPTCRGWASTNRSRPRSPRNESALGPLGGIVTVVVMLVFIGIWVWAWLPHHKRKFDALAKLPMEDERPIRRTSDDRFLVDVGDRLHRHHRSALTVFLFLWGPARRHPDAGRRHQRPRLGARRAARRHSRRCRPGGSSSRRSRSRRRSSTSRCIRASAPTRAMLGWTSHDELAQRPGRNRKLRRRCASACAASRSSRSPPTRARCARARCCSSRTAPRAMAATRRGNAALGAPDLTDADWLYGGDGKAILTSILDGRRGVMPPFGDHASDERDRRPRALRREPAGKPHDSLKAQLGKRAVRTLRRVPRRRRQRQHRARRAEPHRRRVALRRQPGRHRRDHPQRPQRRDAGVARAAGRRGRAARRGLGLHAVAPDERRDAMTP